MYTITEKFKTTLCIYFVAKLLHDINITFSFNILLIINKLVFNRLSFELFFIFQTDSFF